MDAQIEYWDAHALLEWQVEFGISEAISETPINRYEIPEKAPKAASVVQAKAPKLPVKAPEIDPVDEAQKLVSQVDSLDGLLAALKGFQACDLHRGARSLVFAEGNPEARVMVIDDAPSREEDRSGMPFCGPAGLLFDKMFDAIGMSRNAEAVSNAVYLSSALPWRPPENRDPSDLEIATLRPFVLKHIELAAPDVVVLMGNHACAAVLGRSGVTRLRGQWQSVAGKAVLPMMNPRALLRTPIAKRDAWSDLLSLQEKLRGLS